MVHGAAATKMDKVEEVVEVLDMVLLLAMVLRVKEIMEEPMALNPLITVVEAVAEKELLEQMVLLM